MKTCEFEGCGRKVQANGLCHSHYEQKRLTGTVVPLYQTRRPNGSIPRIRTVELPCAVAGLKGPCRVFEGSKHSQGYGQINIANRPILVHRYVWEREKGPIPPGMEIDHQCRNRACCNVDHLRVVTQLVNSLENNISPPAMNAKKTHCPRGHPYDMTKKNGGRACRRCRKQLKAEWDRKRKLEAKS